ncbi:MAG: beta-ketoacyl synthase chain length factor [Steroidobacteraceae bacterium]
MNVTAYIEAVSCAAPGLPDWQRAQAVLRGEQAYVASELPVYQPALLPSNERRRASPTVRMAFRVAEAAINGSSIAASELATVFTSADGDLNIAQRICAALAETQRFISPTDFHNSVHNAAAGYWSIASLAKGPSTAIAAFDDSFAVGLLEALGMVQVEQQAALLVAYDVPAPEPLHARRPVQHPAGVGLILTPQRTPNSLARLHAQLTHNAITTMQDAALEALRLSNPAARALPLLLPLARQQSGSAALQLPGNSMAIQLDMDDPR